MSGASEPREWLICNNSRLAIQKGSGAWDLNLHNGESVRAIEKSAFDQLLAENERLTLSVQATTLAFVAMEGKLARARVALGKYANPETHSMDASGFVWSGDYFDYETARAALKDIDK